MTPTALQARARSAFPAGLPWDGQRVSLQCRFRPANMPLRVLQSTPAACAESSAPVPSYCSWKNQTYFTAYWKIEAPEKGLEYSERGIYLLLKGRSSTFSTPRVPARRIA